MNSRYYDMLPADTYTRPMKAWAPSNALSVYRCMIHFPLTLLWSRMGFTTATSLSLLVLTSQVLAGPDFRLSPGSAFLYPKPA